jgi:hypothetical protein
MRLMKTALAIVFSTLVASNAWAQLRHVEMKTLGMD